MNNKCYFTHAGKLHGSSPLVVNESLGFTAEFVSRESHLCLFGGIGVSFHNTTSHADCF